MYTHAPGALELYAQYILLYSIYIFNYICIFILNIHVLLTGVGILVTGLLLILLFWRCCCNHKVGTTVGTATLKDIDALKRNDEKKHSGGMTSVDT